MVKVKTYFGYILPIKFSNLCNPSGEVFCIYNEFYITNV